MSANSNAITPTTKPARSRTLHKVADNGELRFDIVPYRVGDRVLATSNELADATMEGAVTAYDGHSVVLKIDKHTGEGKFDDWSLSLVQSAIPAPISPDETEAKRLEIVAKLDPAGGPVVTNFAKAVIELVRTMDDEYDLLHYMRSVTILNNEAEFIFRVVIEEKNCELTHDAVLELQAAIDALSVPGGPRRLRHLDLKPST